MLSYLNWAVAIMLVEFNSEWLEMYSPSNGQKHTV